MFRFGDPTAVAESALLECAQAFPSLLQTTEREVTVDFRDARWRMARIWGDADRLANGNILVTAGVRSTSASTRIFEITPDGEVV